MVFFMVYHVMLMKKRHGGGLTAWGVSLIIHRIFIPSLYRFTSITPSAWKARRVSYKHITFAM